MSDDAVVRVGARVRYERQLGHSYTDSAIRLDDIEALLARLAAAELDARRLDWLEGEYDREQVAMVERKPLPRSLFRRSMLITRAGIDAARTAERAP